MQHSKFGRRVQSKLPVGAHAWGLFCELQQEVMLKILNLILQMSIITMREYSNKI